MLPVSLPPGIIDIPLEEELLLLEEELEEELVEDDELLPTLSPPHADSAQADIRVTITGTLFCIGFIPSGTLLEFGSRVSPYPWMDNAR